MKKIISIREVSLKMQACDSYKEEQTRQEIYTYLHTHQNGRKMYVLIHILGKRVYILVSGKNSNGTEQAGEVCLTSGA